MSNLCFRYFCSCYRCALNYLFAGPLVVVLATMLFVSIVSGYAFPKYTADLV